MIEGSLKKGVLEMSVLKKIANKAFRAAGRDGYQVDPSLKDREIFGVLWHKVISVLRGFVRGQFFGSRKGLTFMESGISIIGASRIYAGRNLNLEKNVTINALAKNNVYFGDNVTIKAGAIIECVGVLRNLGDQLELGDRVGISQNCFISVRGKVSIGNDTILGPNVKIFSENHNFSAVGVMIAAQGESRKGVSIGENCWLGGQSVILDGVTLGDGCVVAANAVVTKSFPAGSIIAGVPAKVIGNRNGV